MIGTCIRAAAAVLAVWGGLLPAMPWQTAQAAPIVFQKASDNGATDDAGRFTAVLNPGSGGNQALLQLFTATEPGSRITGLYVQDATGAVARDSISGGPLVRLSETQIHEVTLNSTGANKVAVVKALADSLGITLTQANILANSAPTVIRTGSSPAGNDLVKQALENAGASVTLSNRPDPSVPAGANTGVTMPGAAPTGYNLVLASVGNSKINVIKVVREVTGLTLTEAKDLVDNAPSVIQTNATREDVVKAQLALQNAGATVELQPVGGTPGQATPLPPGSAGIVPDFAFGFAYDDPLATPPLQLALDLDVLFTDLLSAWQDGQFLLGLRVTDRAGVSDLYVAANDAPPAQVPEPPTLALVSLALLGLLRGRNARRVHPLPLSRRWFWLSLLREISAPPSGRWHAMAARECPAECRFRAIAGSLRDTRDGFGRLHQIPRCAVQLPVAQVAHR